MDSRREFMAEQMKRLIANDFKPRTTDIQAMAGAWVDQYGSVDQITFAKAIASYIETGTYWPKPKDLWPLLNAERQSKGLEGLEAQHWRWWRAGYQDPETGKFTPCPVCGSVMEKTGRLAIYHDKRRHEEVGVPFFGKSADERPAMEKAS